MAKYTFIFDKKGQVIAKGSMRIVANNGVYVVDDSSAQGKKELKLLREHKQNKDAGPRVGVGKFKEVGSKEGGCVMDDYITMDTEQLRIMLGGGDELNALTRGELVAKAMKEAE